MLPAHRCVLHHHGQHASANGSEFCSQSPSAASRRGSWRLGSCSCLPAHKLHTAAASILFGHINAAYLRSNTDLKVLSTCVQPGRRCPPATPSHAPPSAHPSVEHHPPTYLHQRLLPQAQSFQLSSAGSQRSTNLRPTSREPAPRPFSCNALATPFFMYRLEVHAASKHFDRRWIDVGWNVLDGGLAVWLQSKVNRRRGRRWTVKESIQSMDPLQQSGFPALLSVAPVFLERKRRKGA